MAASDAVDVIVVGGGTAGCVVAARLANEFDQNVVLIERGDDTSSPHPLDLFDSMARPGAIALNQVTFAGDKRQYVSASIIGGGSAVNGLVVMTGDAADYDDWDKVFGAKGWSWEQVSAEFASLDIVPENTSRDHFGVVGRALLKSGINAQPVTLSTHGGVRVSSDSAYLADARASRRLTVRGNSVVTKILCEDATVRGVELADGTRVAAQTVVLAAGALVSPRLVATTGVVHDRLGEGTQDHPSVMFTIKIATPSTAGSPASAIARISSGVVGSRPLDGQVIAYEHIDPTRQWAGVSVMLVDVHSRGRISVAPGAPDVDIAALSDDRDVRAMRELVRQTARLLSVGDFGEAFCDDVGTPVSHLLTLADDALDAWIRRIAIPLSHISCSCAMGRDNPLDEMGRVRGVTGLWVADSSVMPRIVRGNTNLPTTMIASRIAGFLGEQLRANRR